VVGGAVVGGAVSRVGWWGARPSSVEQPKMRHRQAMTADNLEPTSEQLRHFGTGSSDRALPLQLPAAAI